MSRIVVRFEGLCVMFTNDFSDRTALLPSLTVGPVEIDAKTKAKLPDDISINTADYHYPKLTINELQKDNAGNLKRNPHPIWKNKLAVSRGIIVIEAAGNGNANLDTISNKSGTRNLNTRDDRFFKDSGAILSDPTTGTPQQLNSPPDPISVMPDLKRIISKLGLAEV